MFFWCNDPETISYHVGNSNRHALGICLVGDFRTQQPRPEQLDVANHLIKHLQVQIPTMKQVLGHQEYPGYASVANAAGGKEEWIEQTKDVRVNGKDLNAWNLNNREERGCVMNARS
ncbi:N-acetylmuramoyl-L-alanine amidase [Brevibacillus antibioticus]|uniref:N-acetylmuramoyl-L-alanine amidase n=1 Tax=Brevibacillus antibioticus TaxID=2570228 RepID=UPI001FCA96EC|nr:N-acetylmuramoyl-L-alanine amidase [Brevibacillus antibioticus]